MNAEKIRDAAMALTDLYRAQVALDKARDITRRHMTTGIKESLYRNKMRERAEGFLRDAGLLPAETK